MNESINNYNVGDIVKLKYGSFKKNPGKTLVGSHHLFVIVDDNNVCVLSSNMSKVNKRYRYNIEITDWKDAELHKPSHVKTDTYGTVDDFDIFTKIGSLSEKDLSKVIKSYNRSPQNYILEWIVR